MIRFGIILSDKRIQIIDSCRQIIYDKPVDSTMPIYKRVICSPKNVYELLCRIFRENIPLSKRLFNQKQIFITVNPKESEIDCLYTKYIFKAMKWRYTPILVPFALASLIGLDTNPNGQRLIIDIDERDCYISFFNDIDLVSFEESKLDINHITLTVNSIIKSNNIMSKFQITLIGRNEKLTHYYMVLKQSLQHNINIFYNPQSVTMNGLNRIMKHYELYLSNYPNDR